MLSSLLSLSRCCWLSSFLFLRWCCWLSCFLSLRRCCRLSSHLPHRDGAAGCPAFSLSAGVAGCPPFSVSMCLVFGIVQCCVFVSHSDLISFGLTLEQRLTRILTIDFACKHHYNKILIKQSGNRYLLINESYTTLFSDCQDGVLDDSITLP